MWTEFRLSDSLSTLWERDHQPKLQVLSIAKIWKVFVLTTSGQRSIGHHQFLLAWKKTKWKMVPVGCGYGWNQEEGKTLSTAIINWNHHGRRPQFRIPSPSIEQLRKQVSGSEGRPGTKGASRRGHPATRGQTPASPAAILVPQPRIVWGFLIFQGLIPYLCCHDLIYIFSCINKNGNNALHFLLG